MGGVGDSKYCVLKMMKTNTDFWKQGEVL